MSCPLFPLRIHLFAGSGHNYFLSRYNFNCLDSFVPFLYVAQGSFVFVLIFSTAFIHSQHCPLTITPKGHDCPHQTKAAFEKVPIQFQHLENLFCVCRTSVEHFPAFTAPSWVHIPAVNWPQRHVCAVRAASSLRGCCSVLNSFFSHEARPGMLLRLPLCFLLL